MNTLRAPRRAAAGFTLIEVMVALTILSLILVATVAALRTFANTQTSLNQMTERIDELRTVSSFLRDQFESTVLGLNSQGLSLGGDSEESAYFAGNGESMVWKANVKFGENYGGKHLLRVVRQGSDVLLQWQDVPGNLFDLRWEGAQSRQLIANVEDFAIAYRAKPGDDWGSQLDQGVIPALVRLRIKTRERFWPDLIMTVPQ